MGWMNGVAWQADEANNQNNERLRKDVGLRRYRRRKPTHSRANVYRAYLCARSGAIGTELDLRISIHVDDVNEEVAFDNLRLDGTFSTTNNPPQVSSTNFPNIGEPEIGGANNILDITYVDDSAVSVASIDTGDITVERTAGGASQFLNVSGVAKPGSDASLVLAQYTVDAPGGGWDATDNGTYTVTLLQDQIADDAAATAPTSNTILARSR